MSAINKILKKSKKEACKQFKKDLNFLNKKFIQIQDDFINANDPKELDSLEEEYMYLCNQIDELVNRYQK